MRKNTLLASLIGIALIYLLVVGVASSYASGAGAPASGNAIQGQFQKAPTATPVLKSLDRVPPASTPTVVAESVDRVPPASSEGPQTILPTTGGRADSSAPALLIATGAVLLLGSAILGLRQRRSK